MPDIFRSGAKPKPGEKENDNTEGKSKNFYEAVQEGSKLLKNINDIDINIDKDPSDKLTLALIVHKQKMAISPFRHLKMRLILTYLFYCKLFKFTACPKNQLIWAED